MLLQHEFNPINLSIWFFRKKHIKAMYYPLKNKKDENSSNWCRQHGTDVRPWDGPIRFIERERFNDFRQLGRKACRITGGGYVRGLRKIRRLPATRRYRIYCGETLSQ